MDDPPPKPIVFTAHAKERIRARGATEESVVEAIRKGERETAQRGLVRFRLNLDFRDAWMGKWYRVQQVSPIVADEPERFVVVTVYTFYLQEELLS